jgi:outer membrane protein assembly factor BamE
MRMLLSALLLTATLSSCSFFHVHKMDIEQGNILTQDEVSQIHKGMSQEAVKKILGNPVLSTIFNQNRSDYVYTFKSGKGITTETYLRLLFKNGRVSDIDSNLSTH